MISITNLTLVPGAEPVICNGERGIFIPASSLIIDQYKGHETYAVKCIVKPYRPRKNAKPGASNIVASGLLMYPEWSKDKRLESPVYINKQPVVQWLINPRIRTQFDEGVFDDSFIRDVLDR